LTANAGTGSLMPLRPRGVRLMSIKAIATILVFLDDALWAPVGG
jgi:hypothetical protein